MFSTKKYTIKRNKPGEKPRFIGPKRTHQITRSLPNKLLIIFLVLLFISGIGIGIYYIVEYMDKNNRPYRTDKNNNNNNAKGDDNP